MSEQVRGWIYRVSLALIAVLVVYGVLGDQEAAAWIGVVLAITGNGLATLNTSVRKDDGGE